MKYQFCIRFDNIDPNSAASKAVLDCNHIFTKRGYVDYTLTVGDNTRKSRYYFHLANELVAFFLAVKKGSLVGIQYPLLSINNVFKYFIGIARLKNVKFFCIVHDLESLRSGGKDEPEIRKEIDNLNEYDLVIVHNQFMMNWLRMQGLTKKMIPLNAFDYLTSAKQIHNSTNLRNQIVYAGNLAKSTFIYELGAIKTKHFQIYGPNFQQARLNGTANLHWAGEFSPNEIAQELSGDFGLIWDGANIDRCDEVLGNYLKYNNPHKFSLYVAAGLPVIAPRESAIAQLINQLKIGVLIDGLTDLEHLTIEESLYNEMKKNVAVLREKIINGAFFSGAIEKVENYVAGI